MLTKQIPNNMFNFVNNLDELENAKESYLTIFSDNFLDENNDYVQFTYVSTIIGDYEQRKQVLEENIT